MSRRDFETLYYEQQANFSESNGMITEERNRAQARVEAQEAELIALRAKLAHAEEDIAEYEKDIHKIWEVIKDRKA